jgi:signal transduction protein with GAF and PtsI domain
MQRILDRLAGGSTAEVALRQVLRSDYEELMQSTARYLRKTY